MKLCVADLGDFYSTSKGGKSDASKATISPYSLYIWLSKGFYK